MNSTPPHPPRRSGGVRAVFAASGALALLVAVGFIAVGGLALWASGTTDDDGYATSDRHAFDASTAALTSEDLDVDLDGAGWLLDSGSSGDVRVNVTPDSGEPVFVGIARTADVKRYLGGVGHTTVTDFDTVPFSDTDYRTHPGAKTAPRPAEQDIWAASQTGSGRQTLTWDVTDGNWSVVVMNADGSPGVHAGVSAGVKVPYLATVGWTAGGIGLVLLLGAGGLFVLAARPGRDRPAAGTTDPRRSDASPAGEAIA